MTSGAERRRRRRSVAAWCGLLALGATLGVTLAVRGAAGVPPLDPPLPAQPEAASPDPASCAAARHGIPGHWQALQQIDAPAPAMHTWVDPWQPCRLYNAPGAQDLRRSLDGGRTWTNVFHDSQTATVPDTGCISALTPAQCAAQPFSLSGLTLTAPRTVVMNETGNGDAVVTSTDAGRSWRLTDGGLTGLAGQGVVSLVGAPSDPFVEYVFAAPAGARQTGMTLDVTRDQGATWQPLTLPVQVSTSADGIAVDPADPGHLWVLAPPFILEGTGYGTQWSVAMVPAVPQNGAYDLTWPSSIAVIRSHDHPLRLFLAGPLGGLRYTDDLSGNTWTTVGVSGNQPLGMAVDPADQDRMLYVDVTSTSGSDEVDISRDGFDTVMHVPGPVQHYDRTGHTPDRRTELEADTAGDLYVLTTQSCAALDAGQAPCVSAAWHRQTFFELVRPFAEPGLPAANASSASGQTGVPAPSSAANGAVPTPMTTKRTCILPQSSRSSAQGTTLTFDGVDLLYTLWGETGPADYEGVIHRMSPVTCADTGAIVVRFAAADASRILAMACPAYTQTPTADPRHPVIDNITYDANHSVIWATVVANPYNSGAWDSSGSCVFPIALGDVDSPYSLATALPPVPNGCATFLSYDPFDDTLWTCDRSAQEFQGGHLRPGTGASLPTCMARPSMGTTTGGVGSTAMSSWAMGAPGRLYVQAEDDATIAEFDARSCAVLAYYSHRQYVEAGAEDDGMACDATSFGPDQPVIWLRDADGTASAYLIPDGSCPLRTSTVYGGPPVVSLGDTATLCARLTLRGRHVALADYPLTFLVDGALIGTATTGGDGAACVAYDARVLGRHQVHAYFGGNRQYYRSDGAGVVDVVTAVPRAAPPPQPPPVVAAIAAAGGPPPPPQPNPNPAQAASPVHGVQAQPQPQSLPQAQSVTQAQPVAVAEPQEQVQLEVAAAMQQAGEQQSTGSYALSAVREGGGVGRGRAVLGVVEGLLGAAGVGAGMAWVLRLPLSFSTSRVARKRRRRGG